jgi:hypothetical protein
MKKINYLIAPVILLLTSCSPKYITKTTKISPSPKCFKSCNQKYEIDKKVFIQKCQDKVKVCAVETERRVTADFYKYKIKYQKDLLSYKRELVSYQNSMILYGEKFDAYRDRKSKLREEYEDAMDEYYDEKRDYRDKLSVYENWKREKDENEANKRACSSSSKNKYSCQKVREYESKYRFTFSSDIPEQPRYEPRRPHKCNVVSKPEKPLKPLMPIEPILLTIIGKEKEKCASSCAYPLENSCFSSCGGSVKYEQVCIENCKETVK